MPGTNCEKETVYACKRAGAGQVDLRHINELYSDGHGGVALEDYHFLILLGGFLDGDDLGGAKACANRFRFRALPGGGTFLQRLHDFIGEGRLVLGICNGFQLLVKLRLLPDAGNGRGDQDQGQTVTIAPNARGRFEDRWVGLNVDVTNTRSRRAVERIGAAQEGIIRNHRIRRDGSHRDTVIFGIVDDDWPQVKANLERLMDR